MKFFDTPKKRVIFISVATAVLLAVIAAIVVPLALLLPGRYTRTRILWTDTLEPEPTEEIAVTSPAVKLPEKPVAAPTTDKTKPTAFGTVSVSDECYKLDTNVSDGLFAVTYESDENLPAYAYVYVPVTNYDGNEYLKIKADCDSVERLSILAVYYEQYEVNRPAVTVYNNTVMDGDNVFVCELNSAAVLDSAYNVALGEKLTQKSICGFMLMFDSNPKQVVDEFSGSVKVTELAVTDETDPDLSKLYAAPYISAWKRGDGFDSCNITTSRSPETGWLDADISYSVSSVNFARAEAEITNYKPAYTTVRMDMKGAGVKSLTVAIKYTLKSSSENVDYNYLSTFGMSVGGDWDTYEFDFSTLEELKDWDGNTVPGSYVKNLNPTAIYFFLDGGLNNSGRLYVRNVAFEKQEEGGAPRISATWTLGTSGIAKSNVASGGIGTLNYEKRQGWYPVTVNVGAYDPQYTTLAVRVKFYSEYSNLGIALGYGSSHTVILQSAGMSMPTGFGVRLLSHKQEKGEDENGAYTFHTIEIDFSDARTTKNGSELLAEQSITKILLYIDSVASDGSGGWMDSPEGVAYPSARRMQFVGMEFKKP